MKRRSKDWLFRAAGWVVAMLSTVRSLLELIRFSHTLFALPFALTSAVLAWKLSGFHGLQLAGILSCMVFARSAAMAFNRLADRRYDALNPRTAMRHLPSGHLSVAAVCLFALLCAAGFVASTMIFLVYDNPYPLYLSLPVLLFLCAYSYTKRFTSLSHVWLGASLGLSPLAAWIAIRPPLPPPSGGGQGGAGLAVPFVLGGAVLCWVAGFDILYACQDVDFDRKARLHSIPATLGVRASLRLAALCHLLMVVLLVVLYWAAAPHLGTIYLAGVAAAALLLIYEHWLVSPDDLSRVNQAFFQVNGIISVGLFLVVVVQLAW